tara:strand:- start:21461 stop:23086 length:1626 start_codon:yes stop_codon:yes gene_type:complete
MENIISNNEESENYLDINEIINFIKRKSKFLTISLISSGLIGSLYALSLDRVWQGEFQIVVEQEKDNQGMSSNFSNLFSNFSGNIDTDINTQILILKSPSVLKPIYNYYNQLNPKFNIKYRDWVNNLEVNLEEMSRVLTITYKDTNKDLILPLLKKISNYYQKYSDIDKKKSLDEKYLNIINQVKLYRKRRDNSLSKLNNFALENDLEMPNGGIPQFSHQAIRIKAITEIRDIDKQIERLKDAKQMDVDSLFYQLNSVPQIYENKIMNELEFINKKILARKRFFKGADDDSKSLLNQKRILANEVYEVAINKLLTEKSRIQASLEAAKRPKQVLIDFNQLMVQAQLDSFLLKDLEKLKNITFIEKSESTKAWKLITSPTLLDDPVAPRRKLITFAFIILGLILSIIYLLAEDARSKIIYSKNYLINLFKDEKFYEIEFNNKYWEETIFYILDNFNSKKNNNISIINSNQIEPNNLKMIINTIKKYKSNKFEINLDDKNYSSNQNIIFLAQVGFSNKDTANQLYNLIKLYSINEVHYLFLSK